MTVVKAPEERLLDAMRNCTEVEQAIQELESSGYTSLGIFQQYFFNICNQTSNKDDPRRTLDKDADVCIRDFYFSKFYNENGVSLYENLLKLRIRICALNKLLSGVISWRYIISLLDLAETYDRLNLFKQMHSHWVTANDLVQKMEERSKQQQVLNETRDEIQGEIKQNVKWRLTLIEAKINLHSSQGAEAIQCIPSSISEIEDNTDIKFDLLFRFYLAVAECLASKYSQSLRIAEQETKLITENWFKTAEGKQQIRSVAMKISTNEVTKGSSKELGDSTKERKRELETMARNKIAKSMMDVSKSSHNKIFLEKAMEYAMKARDLFDNKSPSCLVTSARIYSTQAYLYLMNNEPNEALMKIQQAIRTYEDACNGQVPASVLLKLEKAKLLERENTVDESIQLYYAVGKYFNELGESFGPAVLAGSCRSSCSEIAIDAWKKYIQLSSLVKNSENYVQAVEQLYLASVMRYGECSEEAAKSSYKLGMTLMSSKDQNKINQGLSYLRTSAICMEFIYGKSDKRYIKANKLLEENYNRK